MFAKILERRRKHKIHDPDLLLRNKLDTLARDGWSVRSSMMKKKKSKTKPYLFQTILITFILIFAILLMKQLRANSSGSGAANPLNDQRGAARIEVSGVEVNDFSKTVPNTSSYGYTVVSLNPKHQVLYFPDDELFLVSILGNPYNVYVKVAEQAFLEKLGIDEEQACKLNVSITTPAHLNPDKAGDAYELSFCE